MLHLGKSFNRHYEMRIPFLEGFYNLGIFYNKNSVFLLFNIKPDFSNQKIIDNKYGIKVSMFKNLESSKFAEIFLNLHNFKKKTLDIVNQFNSVKSEYQQDISFILNESITLSRIEIDDRKFYDKLNIYGFSLKAYNNEFVYIIAERQNVLKRLERKVIRTTAIQISTSQSLDLIEEFYQEYNEHKKLNINKMSINKSSEIIKLR